VLRLLVHRFALALLLLPQAVVADMTATVTILEGEAALIRGTTRYLLAEGVRVQDGDIIHATDKGLVRLEFGDGTILDLGPGVRLHTTGTTARGTQSPQGWQHTLLSGLVKLSCPRQAKTTHLLSTPQAAVTVANAVTVLQTSTSDTSLFVESGEARIVEPAPRGAGTTVRAKGGDFYARKGGQRGTIAQRPPQAFISALPRSFLDTLPSRSTRFKDRQVAPKRTGEITYGDVEIWLKADRDVRRPLMRRWQSRARDPEFRNALVANLRHHPEWDPILFPEKYKPKEDKSPVPATAE
jgi:hypothetical protein